MNGSPLTSEQTSALAALANGIIPADERDAGAAAVRAGMQLAAKIEQGVNRPIYLEGLAAADSGARAQFGCGVPELSPEQVHELLGRLREAAPAFFKQLRMDVSALYLSDASVWERIGFPGPSTAAGGYPDFDQAPQS